MNGLFKMDRIGKALCSFNFGSSNSLSANACYKMASICADGAAVFTGLALLIKTFQSIKNGGDLPRRH